MPSPELKRYDETKKLQVLADCLPLDTPFTVGIDPCNICNFHCRFCPTGHPELLHKINRPRGMMDFNLFCKIIEDLAEFPRKIKRLYLYHEGEPLLNPLLPEMIFYAKRMDVAESVQITTNAALLNRNLAQKLIDAGLDVIRISVEHVTDAGYRGITGSFGDYQLIRRNIEILFEERQHSHSSMQIQPKIMDTGLSTAELEKFKTDFLPISDLLNIQQLTGLPHPEVFDFTIATNPTEGSDGAQLQPNRVVCSHPFHVMLVKFSGQVVPCSENWTWESAIGNVQNSRMLAIWNGPALRGLRLAHLRGLRNSIPCCSGCPFVKGLPMENDLDQSRERLIPVYDAAN